MITETGLAALVAHIDALEARLAEQDDRLDFLERERVFLLGGRAALEQEFGRALPSAAEPASPGYGFGAAGQLILTDREMIYARLRQVNRR